jgi:hypothetical protein
MYAISIEQSHAAALLTKAWPFHYPSWLTDHRGLLLIHAGKQRTSKGPSPSGPAMKCNALVGVVELVDCILFEHPGADPDESEYHWVLANPRVFIRPLPYTGRRGLFLVSEELVAAALKDARAGTATRKDTPMSAMLARARRRERKATVK